MSHLVIETLILENQHYPRLLLGNKRDHPIFKQPFFGAYNQS